MDNKQVRAVVRCPNCEWRILDKISLTSGKIEIKCPHCHSVVKIDLSLRRDLKFRNVKIHYRLSA